MQRIMTADEKINESEYNLNKLKNADKWNQGQPFFYEFNSFIASTRSILDHLLDDYATKYNLHIPLEIRDLRSEFNKKAKGNSNAEKFIKWYQQEYDKILADPNCGFLIKQRNVILHRHAVKPKKYVIGMEFPQGAIMNSTIGPTYFPITIPQNENKAKFVTVDSQTGKQTEREVPAKPIMDCYLEENPEQTIEVVCELLLEKIRKMVSEAHSNFPI